MQGLGGRVGKGVRRSTVRGSGFGVNAGAEVRRAKDRTKDRPVREPRKVKGQIVSREFNAPNTNPPNGERRMLNGER